jgi:hypothetical protein
VFLQHRQVIKDHVCNELDNTSLSVKHLGFNTAIPTESNRRKITAQPGTC